MSGSSGGGPAEWGGGAVMTDFEAIMWRAEADPRLRSTGVVCDVLDAAPEWDRLVEAHRWAVSVVTRLGQRVVEDPLRLGPPAWIPDTHFDVAYHLRRVAAPAPGDEASVLAIAETFAMTPLDTARPLWEALLVEGLAGGAAAYLLKLHHCLLDGQAMVQLFDLLHSATPEPSGRAPVGSLSREVAPFEPVKARASDLWEQAGRAAEAGASATKKLATAPRQTIGSAVRWTRSLARVAGQVPAPPSPLLAERGLPRRFGALAVPLDDLRATGKDLQGSVNDVFLASIAGGLRRYHAEQGVEVDELTLAFPVSVRGASDPLGGNRFSGARIAAPVGEPDPRERIRIIHERALTVRKEPALDFLSAVAPIMARVPPAALTRMTASITGSIDVQASNIPGLTRPAYIAGCHITRMFPFGPAPGPPLMITMISHEGTCCIGITMDAVAITDPSGMVGALRAGFDEVLGVAGRSMPPDGLFPADG